MKDSVSGSRARGWAGPREAAADRRQPLPNGRGVIFVVAHASINDTNKHDVAVLDLSTRKHRIVAHGVSGACSDGYLLVAHADGALTSRRRSIWRR
ncbi:MAG: hypothetical protein ABIW79_07145 [Gemmatimonas sp.]